MTSPLSPGGDPAPASTGIDVNAIFLRSCRFDDTWIEHVLGAGPTVPAEDSGEEDLQGVDLEAQVANWFNATSTSALVELTIGVRPRKQPSWYASVTVVGRYTLVGQNPALPLAQFAMGNGLANLVPFVRERLASLTAASQFTTYLLPPLNVQQLLALAAHPRKAGGALPAAQPEEERRPAGKNEPTAAHPARKRRSRKKSAKRSE